MPTRPPSVRKFWGFGPTPLQAPQNVPLPQQMKDRFKSAGLDPFLPYISPYETLAAGTGYRQAANDLRIADAEQDFLDNLGGISQSPNGLQSFLQKNPTATFSPMVQTWAKMRQPVTKDPYEDEVATAGSKYLDSYRRARQSGTDPAAAFAAVRDTITKDKEGAKAKEDEELWFVEKGGDLSDLPTLKGKSKAERLQHIRDKGIPLTTSESNKLSELQSDLDNAMAGMEYDDPDKYTSAIEDVYGRKPATEKEWQEAYFKLKEKNVGPAQKALNAHLDALREQNKRIPGQSPARTQSAPASPQTPNVVPSAQAPPAVVAPPRPEPAPQPTPAPAPTPETTPPPAQPFQAPQPPRGLPDIRRDEEALSKAKGMERIKLLQREEQIAAEAQAATDKASQAKRKEELDAIEAKRESDRAKLDDAVDTMLGGVTDLNMIRNRPPPGQLAFHAGVQPLAVAFVDSFGQPVLWRDVEVTLLNSPRVRSIMETGRDPGARPKPNIAKARTDLYK